MRYLKIFISGLVLPTVLLPFLLLIISEEGKSQLLTLPFIHFLPLIWGIWNVLYFIIFFRFLPENRFFSFAIWGAVLGFLVACYGVFALKIPALFELPNNYLPLIVGPILYAIFWSCVVEPLNRLLGVYRERNSHTH